jgi:hypothetical protein
MAEKPKQQFGTRIPAVAPPAPAKRSGHVALLLMGTFAIGGGAYALMPRNNCEPAAAGMPAPSAAGCPRGSSSGGSGGSSSRSGFYSGDSPSHSPSGTPSESGSGGVTRGGFGSFAHAFTSHFSVGG